MLRRMFTSMIGVAPLAASVSAKPATGFEAISIAKTPLIPPDDGLINLVGERIAEPAGLKDYWAAKEAYNAAKRYRSRMQDAREYNHRNGVPANIACLKSVSAQHKLHMMARHSFELEEADRSFTEMLMDKFGVRSWFNDQRHGQVEIARARY